MIFYFSFFFLIKLIYLLNMSFAHYIYCYFIVCNKVNYFVKQNSQLDRFLEMLQMLTR